MYYIKPTQVDNGTCNCCYLLDLLKQIDAIPSSKMDPLQNNFNHHRFTLIYTKDGLNFEALVKTPINSNLKQHVPNHELELKTLKLEWEHIVSYRNWIV